MKLPQAFTTQANIMLDDRLGDSYYGLGPEDVKRAVKEHMLRVVDSLEPGQSITLERVEDDPHVQWRFTWSEPVEETS